MINTCSTTMHKFGNLAENMCMDHHDQLMEYIWTPNVAKKIGISTCCQSFNPTTDKDIINQQTGAFQTIITGEHMTIPATSSTSRIASLTHPGTLLHRPF